MKIVYIVSQFPCLTETFVAREIQQIAALGHPVTICALRPQAAGGPQGLSVPEARLLRVRPNGTLLWVAPLWALLKNFRAYVSTLAEALVAMVRKPQRAFHVFYVWLSAVWLAYTLRSDSIEYVHGHFLHNEALATMWLARLLAVPYGITAHVASIRHERGLMRKVVQGAALLAGDTEQTLAVYQELAGRPAELIRNGIDVQDFSFSEHTALPPEGKALVLAVGSLLPPKGFDVLVRACAVLHQRGLPFHCRIIGEGIERPNLEALIQENGLGGVVDMPGALKFEALKEQYRQASLLVMPSIPSPAGSDGLPTVLIEAVAYGLPVIGTRHAGLPDLVRHQQTGLLAEPGNVQMLAEYIQTYLTDSALRSRMALNGRALVEREFDLRANCSHLADLMQQAIRRGSNASRPFLKSR